MLLGMFTDEYLDCEMNQTKLTIFSNIRFIPCRYALGRYDKA
jgi:hypothetical protein